MKTFISFLISSTVWLSPFAIGAESYSAGFQHHDQVLARLHHINALEINAGNLARTKGQAAEVRAYGEMLARHHAAADTQVVRTAMRDRVQLRRWVPRTSAEVQDAREERVLMARLNNLRGFQFDRAFLRGMVQGHDTAINWLQAKRPLLRGTHTFRLVQELIPQLRMHRNQAARLLRN